MNERIRAGPSVSASRLIVVPALIAFAVTALRAFGEVHHWPEPIVNSAVCGKAVLGVVWLVPIFGTYFALRLFRAGSPPKFLAWAVILAIVSLLLKLGGTFIMERPGLGYVTRVSLNLAVTALALGLQAVAWPDLFKALLTVMLHKSRLRLWGFSLCAGAGERIMTHSIPAFPRLVSGQPTSA